MPPKNHPLHGHWQVPTIHQTNMADNSLNRSTTAQIHSTDSQANSSLAPNIYAWNTILHNYESVAQTTLPVLNPSLPRNNDCHHNSSANRHVFHDRLAFKDYEDIPPLTVKGFSHNLSATTIGRGMVHLEREYNGRRSQILLTNTLHIPAARTNLISGIQLDKAGIVSTLRCNTVSLSLNNKTIVINSIHNNMYRLHLKIAHPSSISLASQITPQSLTSRIAPKNVPSDFYTASWGT